MGLHNTFWPNYHTTNNQNISQISISIYRPISILPILSKVLKGWSTIASTIMCQIPIFWTNVNVDSWRGTPLGPALSNSWMLFTITSRRAGSTGPSSWILKRHLTSRYQLTRVHGVDSATKELTCVAHGLILSPLIFVIYINELTSVICSECFLYADDTAMV